MAKSAPANSSPAGSASWRKSHATLASASTHAAMAARRNHTRINSPPSAASEPRHSDMTRDSSAKRAAPAAGFGAPAAAFSNRSRGSFAGFMFLLLHQFQQSLPQLRPRAKRANLDHRLVPAGYA